MQDCERLGAVSCTVSATSHILPVRILKIQSTTTAETVAAGPVSVYWFIYPLTIPFYPRHLIWVLFHFERDSKPRLRHFRGNTLEGRLKESSVNSPPVLHIWLITDCGPLVRPGQNPNAATRLRSLLNEFGWLWHSGFTVTPCCVNPQDFMKTRKCHFSQNFKSLKTL